MAVHMVSSYRVLTALLQDKTSLGTELGQSERGADYLWTLVASAPIAGLRQTNAGEAIEGVTEAIKATNKIKRLLEDSLSHMDEILATVDLVAHGGSSVSELRSTVGMAIRS